ncbi:MAG: hypothetical protein AB8H79_17040 [Myxococcota bacterium]
MWAAICMAVAQPLPDAVEAEPGVESTAPASAHASFEEWADRLQVVSAVVEREIKVGGDFAEAADTLSTILALLARQTRSEQALNNPLGASHAAEVSRLVALHRPGLVQARVLHVDALIRAGDPEQARASAKAALAELDALRGWAPEEEPLAKIRGLLARAQAVPAQADPLPLTESSRPRREPEHLRWRLGVQWTLPMIRQQFEGLPVRRSALAGSVGLAIAPTPALCGEVRASWDRWTVSKHPDGVGLNRWRVALSACPRVVVGRFRSFTYGVRPVVGLGVAGGLARFDGAADQRTLSFGGQGRVELPIQRGGWEIAPSVGWAPYGRRIPGEGPVEWPFVRPLMWGITWSVGGRGAERL